MALVKRFEGKIYYPVTFEGDGAAALAAMTVTTGKGKEAPVFLPGELHCREMRKGLGRLLGGEESPTRIATVHTLQRREVFRWPKNNKDLFFCTRSGRREAIALTGLRFFLFETRVALIEMSVSLRDLPLSDVMELTYYLCEVKDEANRFEYQDRSFDPATRQSSFTAVSFSLKEWFLRCAACLPGCRSFEDRDISAIISKPLLYGYYLLDREPEDFRRLACNIAQNYKASYKGVGDDHRHLLRAFENSYWCASYNGAVNVSFYVDDPVTNQFFETTFLHKWESEYLFLFLGTVHQKYAVLRYLAELGELACTSYDFNQMLELLTKGEVMQEKCSLLKNRCFFQLPSQVEHVNRVYSFLQWCFDIPGYLASLDAGVENSISVCQSYVSRVKEMEDLEKSLRATRNEMYIALITASITCLTFFQSSYATLLNLFAGRFQEIGVSSVVVTGTFLATLGTVAVNVTRQLDALQELREKIRCLKGKNMAL